MASNKGTRDNRLLKIRSDNRVLGLGGNRTSNFMVNLGSNCQNVRSVSILNVSFLNTFPNIYGPNSYTQNTSYNNTIFWYTAASSLGSATAAATLTLPSGYYSSGALMTAFGTLLTNNDTANGGDRTFVFTQNPVSNLVTLTVTSASGASLTAYIDMSTPNNNQGDIGDRFSNPMLSLGFTANSPYVNLINGIVGPSFQIVLPAGAPGTSISYTAPFLPKLYGPQVAFIKSQAIAPSHGFDEKGIVSPMMLSVPITAPYGQLNVFECKQDVLCEIMYRAPRNLENIDIQLVDHEDRELPLYDEPLDIELRIWFNVY